LNLLSARSYPHPILSEPKPPVFKKNETPHIFTHSSRLCLSRHLRFICIYIYKHIHKYICDIYKYVKIYCGFEMWKTPKTHKNTHTYTHTVCVRLCVSSMKNTKNTHTYTHTPCVPDLCVSYTNL